MNNIKIWKIKEDLDYLIPYCENSENQNNTKLLNIKSNIQEYDVLENAVFQIANMHLNRLNIVLDDSIYIEFWLKNKSIYNMHLDCDEYEKKNNGKYYHPFISCITYLNDHLDPTLISNVTHEEYKYKEFEEQDGFSLIFPEKGKHISFDGSKYHGVTSFDNFKLPRYILAVNIWNTRKPTNIEYYISSNVGSNLDFIFIEKIDSLQKMELKDDSKINNLIFNDLFYEKQSKKISEINDWKDISKNILIYFKKKELAVIFDKKNDIKSDLDFVKNNGEFTMNRFLQRLVFPKIYSVDICKWIIAEGEKYASKNGGWNTHRHKHYPTTDLPIHIIPNVFSFIASSLPNILENIGKMYGLLNVKMNILDMFLVKYNENLQNSLELHKDGSILSFNISLSDTREYEGGGTLFEDGIHYNLEQGDMLVHCGKVNHTGIKITKGNRYILVAFIDVFICD